MTGESAMTRVLREHEPSLRVSMQKPDARILYGMRRVVNLMPYSRFTLR